METVKERVLRSHVMTDQVRPRISGFGKSGCRCLRHRRGGKNGGVGCWWSSAGRAGAVIGPLAGQTRGFSGTPHCLAAGLCASVAAMAVQSPPAPGRKPPKAPPPLKPPLFRCFAGAEALRRCPSAMAARPRRPCSAGASGWQRRVQLRTQRSLAAWGGVRQQRQARRRHGIGSRRE